MSTLAINFVACMLEKRHLSLQFTLLSQDEIQDLSKELGFSQFQGTLNDLIDLFLRAHSTQDKYYLIFASLGSVEWTQEMIDRGGSVHAWTVGKAASHGHVEIIKLIARGQSEYFAYAAIIASRKGRLDVIKALFDQDLIKLENGQRYQLIGAAMFKNQVEVVRYLLQGVGRTDSPNFQSCRDIAVMMRNQEIINLFGPSGN